MAAGAVSSAQDPPQDVRWKWLLLAVCAFGVVTVGAIVWMAMNIAADPGINDAAPVRPYVYRLTVAKNSEAASSGLRTGDLVDIRQLAPAVRYRLLNFERFVIGEPMTFPVLRGGRTLQFTLTATAHAPITWDSRLAFAGNLWVLLFAALIAWRRPENAEARLLSLFLSTSILGTTLGFPWLTHWPAADALVNAMSWPLSSASNAFFVAYTMLFAHPPSRVRQILSWVTYAICTISALYEMVATYASWTGTIDTSVWWGESAYLAPIVSALACAVAALLATRGAERTRMSWAIASVGLWYLVPIGLLIIFLAFHPIAFPGAAVQNTANFILPIGLTYSVLNRRLLDIGYALNRATIFTIVSVIIVGAFMLAEWLMGNWLATQSHVTNIAISALLVVALGFSSRAIHRRVDRAVDLLFFRKRYEDESAIRELAREAAFATDANFLLTSATATLEKHADAEHVTFALDDGSGRYDGVPAGDPAILALKTRHRPVDLHGMGSELRGEFAYPMAIGGRLVGVLVLGPKRSGEPYAPDESHAIAALATAVGGALAMAESSANAGLRSIMPPKSQLRLRS